MAKSAGMAPLMQAWQGWSARFAALQQREKLLVIGATVFAIGFGGYTLWIEPAQLQKTRLAKSLAQQQQEQAQLQAQLQVLVTQDSDPDSANRAALAELDRQLAEADRDIHGFDQALVSPQQAPALLQTLLGRHRGLTLVSLATLPPQPLVAPPEKKDDKPGAAKAADKEAARQAAQSPPPDTVSNLYKHGIELKISGGYHELLAYVSELENGSQRLLWGGMALSSPTDKYPVSELTLTVYTLSLEATWLRV